MPTFQLHVQRPNNVQCDWCSAMRNASKTPCIFASEMNRCLKCSMDHKQCTMGGSVIGTTQGAGGSVRKRGNPCPFYSQLEVTDI